MIFPSLFKKQDASDNTDDDSTPAPAAVRTKKTMKRATTSPRKIRRVSHAKRSYHQPSGLPAADRFSSYDVLLRPVVTEKAADLSEKGVYAFLVHDRANKFSVANAIEAVYGVRPRQVRIARRPSRRKQIRTRTQQRPRYGYTASRKTAYIVLKPGDTITLV